jgi:hypothetical protein
MKLMSKPVCRRAYMYYINRMLTWLSNMQKHKYLVQWAAEPTLNLAVGELRQTNGKMAAMSDL